MTTPGGVRFVPGRSMTSARAGSPRHTVPPLVFISWAALFLNVLAFSGTAIVLPIPHAMGQLITQGALLAAGLVALMVNPRAVLRPNLFLMLLTLMAIVALMVSIHNEFMLSSTFRACRLIGFVAVLWLLTPFWGRPDMLLLRCHRRCLWIVLGTVILGAALSPGRAFAFDGRLAGVLWPIPPTQVAHYAAILVGTSIVLWLTRVIRARNVVISTVVGLGILIATHTRTALLALLIGLVVAGASLFLGHARVRHTSLTGAVVAVLGLALFAPDLTRWARRGQTTAEAAQLTGRTKVWSAIFDTPRPRINEIFGSGLSNKSFNGLPIDSNWVATFLDQGWFGLAIIASFLVALLVLAITQVRGPRRAVALFIIAYCIVASITETGLGDASPYLLDLAVAASLLVPESGDRQR